MFTQSSPTGFFHVTLLTFCHLVTVFITANNLISIAVHTNEPHWSTNVSHCLIYRLIALMHINICNVYVNALNL